MHAKKQNAGPVQEDKLNEFMKYDVYEKLNRALSSTSSYSTERKKGQKERRNTRNTRKRHYSKKEKKIDVIPQKKSFVKIVRDSL
tara:strand:- start:391 stop:645 length:255 start_codon:yes stop_codon:yes gene_type:complete